MATLPEVPTSENLLQSRLQVYETEIRQLTKQKEEHEIDASEAKASLQKITAEFQLERQNCESMRKENEELKAKIMSFSQEEKTLSSNIETIKFEKQQLCIRAEEAEKKTETQRQMIIDLQQQLEEKEASESKVRSCLKKEHAKEIGKIKNEQSLLLEERVNNFAKSENALKAEINQLNGQIKLMDREYKDTIASQAQRLVAYEHQLNIMEKEMGRLRIQNDYARKPKWSIEDMEVNRLKNENMSLKTENSEKSQQINDLVSRLNLVRINTHHDFRDSNTRF